MKRCPECRRDYYDDSLSFCLEDGAALVSGIPDEPATAIIQPINPPSEAKTQIQTRHQSGDLSSEPPPTPRSRDLDKRLRFAPVVLGVLMLGGFLGYQYLKSNTSAQIDSIAVLPFVNQNSDPDAEYLSDGLTESIINNLSQLDSLRVSPRTAVFRFKGKDTDPIKAAADLGVRSVVTGRILQRGEELIVSAELLDVSNNRQLWGEQYHRKLSDALRVQQAISREISERLRTKLTGDEKLQLTKRDTINPDAYAAYIKGRYYWNKRTAANITRALEEFQGAVNNDPNYALAYSGLADCYVVMGDYAGSASADTVPRAIAYAERALELDGSLAEARVSLAFAYHQSWRWQDAEAEFARAMQMGANYPTAHHWYYLHLRDLGRIHEALSEIKRAHELDPISPIISSNVGLAYLSVGELDLAAEQFRRVMELDPNFPRGRGGLGLVYLQQDKFVEAVAELEKSLEMIPSGDRQILRDLAYAYGRAGARAKALVLLDRIKRNHENKQALAQDVAAVYVGLGDFDQAFEWLEKDFQARDARLARVRYQAPFIQLRKDPRFADMLRRMGLPSSQP